MYNNTVLEVLETVIHGKYVNQCHNHVCHSIKLQQQVLVVSIPAC